MAGLNQTCAGGQGCPPLKRWAIIGASLWDAGGWRYRAGILGVGPLPWAAARGSTPDAPLGLGMGSARSRGTGPEGGIDGGKQKTRVRARDFGT